MTLTEISIKRPSLIIVLFSVLMLGGLYCYSLLSYELMPDFSLPTLTIKTPYPGASPADVEQSVTKKVEDVVSGLDGIKDITSQSMEGVSVITAEFVVGSKIDEQQQAAQRKINNILSDLPDDVETPSISKITPSDQPIMQLYHSMRANGVHTDKLLLNTVIYAMGEPPLDSPMLLNLCFGGFRDGV